MVTNQEAQRAATQTAAVTQAIQPMAGFMQMPSAQPT